MTEYWTTEQRDCYGLKCIFIFCMIPFIVWDLLYVKRQKQAGEDWDKVAIELASGSVFFAYFLALIFTSEFDVLGVTLEHLVYNYYQLCASIKFKVLLGNVTLLGDKEKQMITANLVVVFISAVSGPFLFTNLTSINIVWDVNVKIYRYIWLLTTAACDLFIIYLGYSFSKKSASLKAIAIFKFLTYVCAVPVLLSFWSGATIVYCIFALPMRFFSVFTCMSRFPMYCVDKFLELEEVGAPSRASAKSKTGDSKAGGGSKAAEKRANKKAELKKKQAAAKAKKDAEAKAAAV